MTQAETIGVDISTQGISLTATGGMALIAGIVIIALSGVFLTLWQIRKKNMTTSKSKQLPVITNGAGKKLANDFAALTINFAKFTAAQTKINEVIVTTLKEQGDRHEKTIDKQNQTIDKQDDLIYKLHGDIKKLEGKVE